MTQDPFAPPWRSPVAPKSPENSLHSPVSSLQPAASSLRILGIDPGLNITGYAVLDARGEGLAVVEAGVIRGGNNRALDLRLGEIFRGMSELLVAFSPSAVALEELYSHYDASPHGDPDGTCSRRDLRRGRAAARSRCCTTPPRR